MKKEKDKKSKIKKFSIEEMGVLHGNPKLCYLQLDPGFVRNHLAEEVIFEEKKKTGGDFKVSNVECPFCQNGFIRLMFSGPAFDTGIIGENPFKPGDEGKLAGKSYQYECTNKKCIAKFKGEDITLKN
ncbi:hypothetical protein ACFLZ9_01830 [Patescibacteria group bacterium]